MLFIIQHRRIRNCVNISKKELQFVQKETNYERFWQLSLVFMSHNFFLQCIFRWQFSSSIGKKTWECMLIHFMLKNRSKLQNTHFAWAHNLNLQCCISLYVIHFLCFPVYITNESLPTTSDTHAHSHIQTRTHNTNLQTKFLSM